MKSGPGLLRLDLPSRGRLIFIGDIHGCYAELSELLAQIGPSRGDAVIAVGDMVRKGPDPVLCLELWRKQGYLSVIGNNEEKLLRAAGLPRLRRVFLPAEDAAVIRNEELLDLIRGWPRVIDTGRGVVAVHGGLLPRMRVRKKDVDRHSAEIVALRWIQRVDRRWEPAEKSDRSGEQVLWADVWSGPETVVYGHTPLREPRVERYSIGLDTGCVYGGWLTAAIYDGKWSFKRVQARGRYAR